MKNTRFGIEIEMVMNRSTAAKIVAGHFGTFPYFEGGVYQIYSINDTKNRAWKVMYDGSIKTSNSFYRCELVSPPLNYEDIEDLQEVIRKLRKAGAKINNSCGIHIHIDAAQHTVKSIKNLFNIVYSKDDMLQRSLNIPIERMGYCKKIKEGLLNGINKAKNINQILDAWYAGHNDKHKKYSRSRYFMLNLHCL